MGATTEIAWCHSTFNPWIGCTKVHEGCSHCYAESLSKRTGKAVWGPHGTRVKTSDSYWRQPLKWNREAEAAGERRRVFCASLSDVFEDWQGPVLCHRGGRLFHGVFQRVSVPPLGQAEAIEHAQPVTLDDLRRDLFSLIDQTPWLDWLLLTKRPENVRRMWPGNPLVECDDDDVPIYCHHYDCGSFCDYACNGNRGCNPPSAAFRSNVALGTSVSNQETADRMVPELLKCRDLCPVLFLSAEPLLGPLNLSAFTGVELPSPQEAAAMQATIRGAFGFDRLPADSFNAEYERRLRADNESKWLIVSGESGPGARPMHAEWARSLRDQCQAAGVPFFFKQWGEWAEGRQRYDWIGVASSVQMRAESVVPMSRVGKKTAGRLLDGREWSEFPAAAFANK